MVNIDLDQPFALFAVDGVNEIQFVQGKNRQIDVKDKNNAIIDIFKQIENSKLSG